jgi:hypothetical protein
MKQRKKYATVRLTIFRVGERQEAHGRELVRAIRFMVAAEYEATQMSKARPPG